MRKTILTGLEEKIRGQALWYVVQDCLAQALSLRLTSWSAPNEVTLSGYALEPSNPQKRKMGHVLTLDTPDR
jgi:hypothetical protein